MFKKIVILISFFASLQAVSQPLSGTTGLMNVPTADMQRDGTVIGGANFLPVALTPDTWDYNTGNYYFNITFLPFVEVSYRMTLLKLEEYEGFSNQDRSVSLRLRAMQEKKNIPAIVIGFNDLVSSTAAAGVSTKKYFSSVYIASTKNFELKKQHFSTTIGYVPDITETKYITGIFAGISYSPARLESLKLMAEYDTRVFNAGASVLLFKHLYVYGIAHELKRFAGGFAFVVPLIR